MNTANDSIDMSLSYINLPNNGEQSTTQQNTEDQSVDRDLGNPYPATDT
jgi:hypothetical protein